MCNRKLTNGGVLLAFLLSSAALYAQENNGTIMHANPALASAPSDAPTLYVVTRSTQKFRIGGRDNPSVGLFTTTDRGQTWQHHGWHYTKCFSVAIAPGSGGQVLYLSCGNGVLKSADGGDSWTISSGWQMTECLKAAVEPGNPQIVYAATAYGIFRSTDGGQSWQEKNSGLASTFTASILIDVRNPATVWTATEAGVYRSTDRGETWSNAGLAGKGIRTLVQSRRDASVFWLGTEDDGVFVSRDGGTSWQPRSEGLAHRTVYALALDPADAQVLYAGTFRGGVYKSRDGGQSWQAHNNGLTVLDIHALLVDPGDSRVVYCGTMGGGVFMSEDAGANWRFIGLETSQVWDLVME